MDLNFDNTVVALGEYDRKRPERERLWDAAQTNGEVAQAQAAEEAARLLVVEAFYEDTKDRNVRSNLTDLHPDDPWLRNLVAKHGRQS
jgi:hypothetical protein